MKVLLIHDGLMVLTGPVGQDRAGDAPEEGAVGPRLVPHLISWKVLVNVAPVLDKLPGVLDRPIRPVLLHVEHLDVNGLDCLLFLGEDVLQEAEPAAPQLWDPVAN